MKKIIKALFLFIGCGIGFCALIFVVIICYGKIGQIRFDNAVAKCKTIQIGMTREEVLSKFGKDVTEYEDKNHGTSSLVIARPSFYDWAPSILIRKETGKVEEVNCTPH